MIDKKTEYIYGTRAVAEAVKAGKQIEKIILQQGLSNPLITELKDPSCREKNSFSAGAATQNSAGNQRKSSGSSSMVIVGRVSASGRPHPSHFRQG